MIEIADYLKKKGFIFPSDETFAYKTNQKGIDLMICIEKNKISAGANFEGLNEVVLPAFECHGISDFIFFISRSKFIQYQFPELNTD